MTAHPDMSSLAFERTVVTIRSRMLNLQITQNPGDLHGRGQDRTSRYASAWLRSAPTAGLSSSRRTAVKCCFASLVRCVVLRLRSMCRWYRRHASLSQVVASGSEVGMHKVSTSLETTVSTAVDVK